MSVYGFNDKLEKVPVITLPATLNLLSGREGTISWGTSVLNYLGIDTDNLEKYAVLDVLHSTNEVYWVSGTTSGYYDTVSGTDLNVIHPYPKIAFDTNSKSITLRDYNGLATEQTLYYKVRLMKVE